MSLISRDSSLVSRGNQKRGEREGEREREGAVAAERDKERIRGGSVQEWPEG